MNTQTDTCTTLKSLSSTRLIFKFFSTSLNKNLVFLIDTGANVGIISDRVKGVGSTNHKITILDASGSNIECPVTDLRVAIITRTATQFVKMDISSIIDSIEKETKVRIDGIISLTQLRMQLFATINCKELTLTL